MTQVKSDAYFDCKQRVSQLQNQGFSKKTAFKIMHVERRKSNKEIVFVSYEQFQRHLTYCKSGR